MGVELSKGDFHLTVIFGHLTAGMTAIVRTAMVAGPLAAAAAPVVVPVVVGAVAGEAYLVLHQTSEALASK